jgi:tetratricopeptide (TPR) repeat protein
MTQPPALPEPSQPADALEAAHELVARSEQAHESGEHLLGLDLAQRAVEIALRHDDAQLTAEAYSKVAAHRWRLGEFEQAVVAGREAVRRWELIGGPRECDTLCLLAIAYSELGLQEQALQASTLAFDKARANHYDLQTVRALNRIGVCFDRLGDHSQSEKFLLQSLGQARELAGHDEVMGALNNLMATTISAFYHHRQRGDAEQATAALQRSRQYGRQAISLARRHADSYRLAVL